MKLLKATEAGKILNVHARTVKRWAMQGKIKCVKLPSGVFMIPQEEIDKILKGGIENGY